MPYEIVFFSNGLPKLVKDFCLFPVNQGLLTRRAHLVGNKKADTRYPA